MSNHIYAPFTDEQVKTLNYYQQARVMHPFTCSNRGDGNHTYEGGNLGILTATTEGWICKSCDYTQRWAHAFMADEKWIRRLRKAIDGRS